MLKPFSQVLSSREPQLFDGAMGTELYARGVFINRCFEEANLTDKALVQAIHADYLAAGCNIISTNSWGANAPKLSKYNLDDRFCEINAKAVCIARLAAGTQAYVAGSIGPLGIRVEPFGPTSLAEVKSHFADQAKELINAGVDLLTLETFVDLAELQQAIAGVRQIDAQIPLFAHVMITANGSSPHGTPVQWMFAKLSEWEVDVVGLNCSIGPQPMYSCIEGLPNPDAKPLSVLPNAGLPKIVDGRQIYMATPEYLAEFSRKFYESGVQFVGGCCGTSPAHIRHIARNLGCIRAVVAPKIAAAPKARSSGGCAVTRIPLAEKSRWSQKIAAGESVASIELLPPVGVDPSQIIARSRRIKEAGVDAINIPDGPRASARMSAILTAVMVEQQAGIETVLHYTCRDRNLLGMQSDMLGAHAIGLRNVLLITGDPPKLGSYPNATGVFDVDAIGLTNMVHRLNSGIDLGDREIGNPAAISIGVGVNPGHGDFEYELKRFAWKVDAGAEWAITQPIFDMDLLRRFLDIIAAKSLDIPIIAGIWPLASYKNAVFMNNEVPGITVPAAIIDKMAQAKCAEDGKKIGMEIAAEMVAAIRSELSGIQVSAPFGRIDLALGVLA